MLPGRCCCCKASTIWSHHHIAKLRSIHLTSLLARAARISASRAYKSLDPRASISSPCSESVWRVSRPRTRVGTNWTDRGKTPRPLTESKGKRSIMFHLCISLIRSNMWTKTWFQVYTCYPVYSSQNCYFLESFPKADWGWCALNHTKRTHRLRKKINYTGDAFIGRLWQPQGRNGYNTISDIQLRILRPCSVDLNFMFIYSDISRMSVYCPRHASVLVTFRVGWKFRELPLLPQGVPADPGRGQHVV